MFQAFDGPDSPLDTYIYAIICTLHIAKQVYSDMLNFKSIVYHIFINV